MFSPMTEADALRLGAARSGGSGRMQASQRQPVHVQDVLEAVVAMWDVNAVHPQDVLEVVVATLDAAGARSRVWC